MPRSSMSAPNDSPHEPTTVVQSDGTAPGARKIERWLAERELSRP